MSTKTWSGVALTTIAAVALLLGTGVWKHAFGWQQEEEDARSERDDEQEFEQLERKLDQIQRQLERAEDEGDEARVRELRNEGERGNWLQIALDGFYPGTLVRLTLPDGRQLVRESLAGSSYLASEDPRLHFGLGDAEAAAKLEVRWPDGRMALLEDIGANQRILVTGP